MLTIALLATVLALATSFKLLPAYRSKRLSNSRLLAAKGSTNTEHQLVKLSKLLKDEAFSAKLQANLESSSPDPWMLPEYLIQTHFPNKETCSKLPAAFVSELLDMAIAQHDVLPNIVTVGRSAAQEGKKGAITICGDTHGQFFDFLQIFTPEIAGRPSDMNRFVFNGDIVDRGPMALEILSVLLAAKLCHSDGMHILRGNHESIEMIKSYGFHEEVEDKYYNEGADNLLTKCLELFSVLPLGAVLEDSVFITHGGLGAITHTSTVADLNLLNRKSESVWGDESKVDAITELTWADPRDDIEGIEPSLRGGDLLYGPDITDKFLKHNHFNMVIRSHEVKQGGYELQHGGRTLTVFSAPNYCGRQRNLGAVVRFNGDAMLSEDKVDYELKTFTEAKE